jgi:predicted RNA-binding Zn-ribbon protein involved in translation (DUF1610 family)
MEVNPNFLAPCGLYCGVCAIYIAHRDNNQKLKEKLVELYKGNSPGKGTLPNSERLTADEIRCQGCLSQDQFIYCKKCEIRACTQKRGYQGCHQCDEFPCNHIETFPMSVGKRVILRAIPYRREVGTEKWVQDEEARYTCPQCGSKLFRGAMRCNRCKTQVDLD